MDVWFRQADVTVATLLAFFRFSAFFVIAPFPGFRAPALTRLALAAGLAWGFSEGLAPVAESAMLMAVLSEVVIGLTLGFLLQLVVQAFAFGGEAVGTQMGLASPGFADPLEQRLTLFGSSYAVIALGVYAVGDGPLLMFGFLSRFLAVVPPGVAVVGFDAQAVTISAGRTLFAAGMQAAAPVIAAVFAAQLVLAVLARSAPKLNLLVEGPSLTVGTAVVGLTASAYTFAPLIDMGFERRLVELSQWMGS